jgi:lipopolysaccharide transport system ATP-binding protein
MSNIAIRVEDLSKRYTIGQIQNRNDSLRDTIVAGWRNLGRWKQGLSGNGKAAESILWALKDVSFQVARGEVVGIIGSNGAGKSTLLKVLSRITEPTQGDAWLHGRVGSLLEVGTGFHPDLTGRENIYLNGAILGMRKREIARKFDEIVAFSEVEKFLDTPVKRYSSGMYVRLAFAVAAHLEPEILIVDEVLAVGDAGFQKKCLGKMGDVAQQGRTVLFVSHNMVAVQTLCERAIWLNQGKIASDGRSESVVRQYLGANASSIVTEQVYNNIEDAPGNDIVRLHRVCVRPEGGAPTEPITMQTPLVVEVEFWNQVAGSDLDVTLHLYTEQEVIAFTTGSVYDPVWRGKPLPVGLYRSTCHIPGNLLNSGVHRILLLVVKDQSAAIFQHQSVSFEVIEDERVGAWYGKEPGVVMPVLNWTTESLLRADGVS